MVCIAAPSEDKERMHSEVAIMYLNSPRLNEGLYHALSLICRRWSPDRLYRALEKWISRPFNPAKQLPSITFGYEDVGFVRRYISFEC